MVFLHVQRTKDHAEPVGPVEITGSELATL